MSNLKNHQISNLKHCQISDLKNLTADKNTFHGAFRIELQKTAFLKTPGTKPGHLVGF
jgi:hypothetical protein